MNTNELQEMVAVAKRWRERGLISFKVNVSQSPAGKRQRLRGQWRRNQQACRARRPQRALTPRQKGLRLWQERFGAKAEVVFEELGQRLGISAAAARMRYYRGTLSRTVISESMAHGGLTI